MCGVIGRAALAPLASFTIGFAVAAFPIFGWAVAIAVASAKLSSVLHKVSAMSARLQLVIRVFKESTPEG
jgi:hypothetical protein